MQKVCLAMRKELTCEYANELKFTWEHAERRGWYCKEIEFWDRKDSRANLPVDELFKVLYSTYMKKKIHANYLNRKRIENEEKAKKRIVGKVYLDKPKPYLKISTGGTK